MYTLRAVSNEPRRTKLPRTIGKVNGAETEFIIDTGAGTNILDKNGFNNLRDKLKLDRTDIRVRAYKSEQPITLLGIFFCKVQVQERETQTTFNVTVGQKTMKIYCDYLYCGCIFSLSWVFFHHRECFFIIVGVFSLSGVLLPYSIIQ